MTENNNLNRYLETAQGPRKDIYFRMMKELENNTTKKQQHLWKIICKKHLNEILINQIDNVILTHRADETLNDIFYHFIDAKTLEQGRVNIKHRSDITRCSTLSFIIDKTNHFKTFICLEYILDTKIYEHNQKFTTKRKQLYELISQKVLLEMCICRIDEELEKEPRENLIVINKIYNLILSDNYDLEDIHEESKAENTNNDESKLYCGCNEMP